MLKKVSFVYNKKIKIIKDNNFSIDRSLNSNKFKNQSKYKFPSWIKMIKDLKQFNEQKIFKDKTILITGGTGSFGTHFLNKLLKINIKKIKIFSRDEKKQEDLRNQTNNKKIEFYIGDVRDYKKFS